MLDINAGRRIAELSKLEFSEDELSDMIKDMNDIVKIIDTVCDFDNQASEYRLNEIPYDDLRDGKIEKSCATDVITANSKKTENNAFVVPRVI